MPSNAINLTFVNSSNDQNNSSVVIFQKNLAKDGGNSAIAWKVIQNCGINDRFPFRLPMQVHVSAIDSQGSHLPQFAEYEGRAFQVELSRQGEVFRPIKVLPSSGTNRVVPVYIPTKGAINANIFKNGRLLAGEQDNNIEVQNRLPSGAITACVYKDGKVLDMTPNLLPGKKAVFQFDARICICVLGQVLEGQVIDISNANLSVTEINLLGITSADIVMTGGGPGPNSTPLEVHLENIER